MRYLRPAPGLITLLKPITCLIVLSFLTINLFAQEAYDSSFTQEQVQKASTIYEKALNENQEIYSGKDYIPYIFKRKSNPFVEPESMQQGWIRYKGMLYNDVMIQFDITRDEVIVLTPSRLARLVLENNWIDSFGFSGHNFINLPAAPSLGLSSAGFYDHLTTGSIQIFALRKKRIREILERDFLVREFVPANKYVALKEGKFYSVSSKKEIMNLLGHKRKKINQQLRSQKASFKNDGFESAIVEAANLYDELPN